jgi:phosphate starvation-inducible PhoH-like protein
MAKRKIIDVWEAKQAEKLVEPEKKIKYKSITGQNLHQKEYIKSILSKRTTIGIGYAGVGKTFIAVALGIQGVLNGQFDKILVCRPAREAIGEELGFLPGDFKMKINPFLMPIWDAIDDIIENPEDAKKFKSERIDIVTFAHMRGRSFKHRFVIADELQNATEKQLDMLITRMGEGAKYVLNGDPTQSDLPEHHQGALLEIARIVASSENYGIVNFEKSDIVRDKAVEEYLNLKEQYYKPRRLEDRFYGYMDRDKMGGW